MYCIRIESFVFSDLSHITNTLTVLKSSFLTVLFCFVVGILTLFLLFEQPSSKVKYSSCSTCRPL